MAIAIATAGRHKSVATLAKALFDTKDSPELQARAEAALLKANPGLAAEGGIRPGMRIVMPSRRDLVAKELSGESDDIAEPLLAMAARNAELLRKHVTGPVAAAIEDTKKNAAEVKDVVGRLAASRPEIKSLAAQIQKDAAAEADRIAKGAEAVLSALKQLAKDLPKGSLRDADTVPIKR